MTFCLIEMHGFHAQNLRKQNALMTPTIADIDIQVPLIGRLKV